MGWFEDHLAAVGRAVDDRVQRIQDAIRYRPRRHGPGLGEKVRRAKVRAAEVMEDRVVRPARHLDPQLRRKILLGALCVPVLILAGIGLKTLVGPPAIDRATDEEIARLKASLERAGASPGAPVDLFSRYVRPSGE